MRLCAKVLLFLFLLFLLFFCIACNPSEPTDPQNTMIYKPTQPVPSSRLRLGRMLEIFQKKRGAEIGVQKGQFSSHLLTDWTSCEYFLLTDPWLRQDNYTDSANVDDAEQEANYQETIRRLAFFSPILDIKRMTSKEAAALVPDNSLDFLASQAPERKFKKNPCASSRRTTKKKPKC